MVDISYIMRGTKPTISEKPKSIVLAIEIILKNKEKVQIQEPTANKVEDAPLHLIVFRKGDFQRMKIRLI